MPKRLKTIVSVLGLIFLLNLNKNISTLLFFVLPVSDYLLFSFLPYFGVNDFVLLVHFLDVKPFLSHKLSNYDCWSN